MLSQGDVTATTNPRKLRLASVDVWYGWEMYRDNTDRAGGPGFQGCVNNEGFAWGCKSPNLLMAIAW
jgi:hypothetical protein